MLVIEVFDVFISPTSESKRSYPTSHQPTNFAPRQARNHMRPRPSVQQRTISASASELCCDDWVLQSRRRGKSDSVQHEPGADGSLFPPNHQLPRLGPNPISSHHQIRRESPAVAQHDPALRLRLEIAGHADVEFHRDGEGECVLVETLVEFGSVDCKGRVRWVSDGKSADEGPVELLHGCFGRGGFSSRAFHEAGPFLGRAEGWGCDDYHFAWKSVGVESV